MNEQQNNSNMTLSRNRRILQMYGPYFAQQLFTVRMTNPDLKYKEDLLADKNVLRRPTMVYVIEPVDISAMRFVERDVDGNPKIIFNDGVKNAKPIVFPVEPPKFCKATRESLAECIDNLNKNNAKPIFFSAADLTDLVDLVRDANQSVLNFYNDMSRKFLQLSETISGMMDANERMKNDYFAQCRLTEDNIEINISVETD